MGRKTDGEKIDELQKSTAGLEIAGAVMSERLAFVQKSLNEAHANHKEMEQRVRELERDFATKLADLQRATETQIAALRLQHEQQVADLRRSHESETKLLKQQVEELKQEQLRWGARLWQVAVGVVVVVIGAAFTTYLGLKK